MLVLTRNPGQEIVLGEGIVITVVAVRGKQVRLGIKAPKNVHIRREELALVEELAAAKVGPAFAKEALLAV